MKPKMFLPIAVIALALVLSGCGHKHDHSRSNAEEGHSHNADGSHSDSAQSFSGATHKEDGITLLDETRELLGLKIVEVEEKVLPRKVRFAARVFDTRNPETPLASGIVAKVDAMLLWPGLPVLFKTGSDENVTGVIQQVTQPLANGEAEVVVALSPISVAADISPLQSNNRPAEDQSRLTSAATAHGEFGEVTVSVPGKETSLVVPREAVIKATNGNLVYVVNGNAYTLMWIELGVEADGWVEVTDGLLEGDSVVTHGVMDLWLVELRAVKGGQGCCPTPPKKGKS